MCCLLNSGEAANAFLQVWTGQNPPSCYPGECFQKGQSFRSERILPAHNLEMGRGVYRTCAIGHPSLPGVSKAHTWACVGEDQSRHKKFGMKSNHAKLLRLTPVPMIINTPPTWGQIVASSSQKPPLHQNFATEVECSSLFGILYYREVFTSAFLNCR